MKLEVITHDVLDTLLTSIENKTEVMGYDNDGKFHIYKKCLILFNREDPRFDYNPTEILIPIKQYYILRNYVEQTGKHYIPEAEIHFFYSVEDFWDAMEEAQKHKLF